METILFNIFALLTVLSALLVVVNPFSRNPVTSAMFLVTTMISISGLFVLLNAYFLAAVQILVYAGAVMVLFLFVIMLLDVEETVRRKLRLVSLTMGFLSVAALFGVYKSSLDATYVKDVDSSQDIVAADEIDGFWSEHFEAATSVGESESFVTVGSTQALGKELFSSVNGFILPFEIVSILLLVAMIGVILLSKKETK